MICCLAAFQRSYELKGTHRKCRQNITSTVNTSRSSSERYWALRINSTQISNTIKQSWSRAAAIHLPTSAPDCTVTKDLTSPTTLIPLTGDFVLRGQKTIRKIKNPTFSKQVLPSCATSPYWKSIGRSPELPTWTKEIILKKHSVKTEHLSVFLKQPLPWGNEGTLITRCFSSFWMASFIRDLSFQTHISPEMRLKEWI